MKLILLHADDCIAHIHTDINLRLQLISKIIFE